jgi:hypothetical protein
MHLVLGSDSQRSGLQRLRNHQASIDLPPSVVRAYTDKTILAVGLESENFRHA